MKKPLSGIIFSQYGMRQAEKYRKKILVPNFVHTRPGQENCEKNRKKNQKIKKPLFGIIFSQNGDRQAEKQKKKKFSPEFRSYSAQGRKFQKKIAKK